MAQYLKHNELTISKGNYKIDKCTGVWNITCHLNCTFCYNRKMRFKSAELCKARNKRLSRKNHFVDSFDYLVKKYKFVQFRYHADGEVYDQVYFKALENIAKRNPQCFFVMYTRAKFLQSSTSNFRIIDSLARETSKHKAIIIEKTDKTPEGYFRCPAASKKDTGICAKTCNYCYDSTIEVISVAFENHQ
mgnify:CR=1 FL=1